MAGTGPSFRSGKDVKCMTIVCGSGSSAKEIFTADDESVSAGSEAVWAYRFQPCAPQKSRMNPFTSPLSLPKTRSGRDSTKSGGIPTQQSPRLRTMVSGSGLSESRLSPPKSPSALNLLHLCGVLATDVVPGLLKGARRDQAVNDLSDVQRRVGVPLVRGKSVDGEDEGSDQAARRS